MSDAPSEWSQLQFERDFVRSLPGADAGAPHLPRATPGACHAAAVPEPAADPDLRAWRSELATDMGLPPVGSASRAAVAALFAGNTAVAHGQPYAMRYGGHQFGNWADQLGDGRVINLGEWRASADRVWTVQLKGAGRTPYSRGADGRAVLRSSIREFVASEAMHALGIPTSRALALVTTGMPVERDMLYDGNPRLEPGAVVTRVAPSFVRLGNFEIHAAHQEHEALRALHDYCLARHFPDCAGDTAAFFAEVCRRTAELMAGWMSVGFVHAVMNTDNLSILGHTIDYGPFAWMEDFDPAWTPNEVDRGRRYGFGRQPQMAQWNLARFGSALLPLGVSVETLEPVLAAFGPQYSAAFQWRMVAKLGLRSVTAETTALLDPLFAGMAEYRLDMTLFFRGLADCVREAASAADRARFIALVSALAAKPDMPEALADASHPLRQWWGQWRELRLREAGEAGVDAATASGRETAESLRRWCAQRAEAMDRCNPAVVPRNWRLADVITAAETGDWSPFDTLLEQVTHPFVGRVDDLLGERPPADAASRPGCGRLTCSS